MVRLHIKRGDQNQFLYETQLDTVVHQLINDIVTIYNGRLKIERICAEMEELAKYGPMFCPEILGLTEEQVDELKLVDMWVEKVCPSGGWTLNKDPIGRRNGRQPQPNMQAVLQKAVADARVLISNKLVVSGVPIKASDVRNALDILRGAVTIVYPMALPPHDNIRMEFSNTEDLAGTQAALEIIEPAKAELWFAGHQMYTENNKRLRDYLGNNDKCKVIVKLTKRGEGAPGREPVMTEEARKQVMLMQYRRQEELRKLDDDSDDDYMNSTWADNSQLKRQVHGLENVNYRTDFFK